jgi:small subunit ribosomal protein S4e
MASKGESKTMKIFAASKAMRVRRRRPSFVTRARAGPHPKDTSVPLSVVLRDLMGIAKTQREVSVVLNERRVLVDGQVVRDPKRPLGFMDVLSLPSISKHYRVVYDKMRRLSLQETDKPSFKLCRIQNKTMTCKGLQLNLHDSRNILVAKDEYKTGGTLKVSIPDQKILEYYPLDAGSIAYVTGGQHAGEVATVQSILAGTRTREPLVVLKAKDLEFQTKKDYVFILGTKTPAIRLREEVGA